MENHTIRPITRLDTKDTITKGMIAAITSTAAVTKIAAGMKTEAAIPTMGPAATPVLRAKTRFPLLPRLAQFRLFTGN